MVQKWICDITMMWFIVERESIKKTATCTTFAFTFLCGALDLLYGVSHAIKNF